jgi:hypothetical protein
MGTARIEKSKKKERGKILQDASAGNLEMLIPVIANG